MKKSLLTIAALSFVAASAHAQDRNIGITADVGTTGVGLHIVVPVSEKLNTRLGFNAFSRSDTESTDDATYKVKAKLNTFDALLDYYPMAGAFRVTSGLVYNGNSIDAEARPTAGGTYTFNGTTYTAADVGRIKGDIDFRKIAPYLGIGWGNAVAANKGFGFTADLGVMFTGKPDASLRSTGCTASVTVCDQLAADLARESAELNDKAKDFRYYPVARVGLTYKF